MVPKAVPLDGGENAQGNADDQGEDEGGGAKLQGGGQPLQDGVGYRLIVDDGIAEVEEQGVTEEDGVLDVEGLVQAQLFAQLVPHFGAGVVVEEQRPGVAGGAGHDEDD